MVLAECLLYLIYPLKWTNLYVPLVPDGLRDVYLESFSGSYIKGAHTRHQSVVEQRNTCVTCNLDNDKNIYVPNNIELQRIPPSKMGNFIDPITQLLEDIQKARVLKNIPTAARRNLGEQREFDRQDRLETNQKITNVFRALMIDLCGDALDPIYWKVTPHQTSPTNTLARTSGNDRSNSNLSQTTTMTSVFSKEKYLHPKMDGIEFEFYRIFVETMSFQNFLKEEMTSTSPTGFKKICEVYSLSTQGQLYRVNSTSLEELETYQVRLLAKKTLCDFSCFHVDGIGNYLV